MVEKELAKEYIEAGFAGYGNSRKGLKRMTQIEDKVEREGDWDKFSKEVVKNLIGELAGGR